MAKILDFEAEKQRVTDSRRRKVKQERKKRKDALIQSATNATKRGSKKAALWSLKGSTGLILRVLVALDRPVSLVLRAIAVILLIAIALFYFTADPPEYGNIIRMAMGIGLLAAFYAIYVGIIYCLAYANEKLKQKTASADDDSPEPMEK